MTPVTTADRYEWWRNRSRAWTFEMCTSTTGHVTVARASRIATEVCV